MRRAAYTAMGLRRSVLTTEPCQQAKEWTPKIAEIVDWYDGHHLCPVHAILRARVPGLNVKRVLSGTPKNFPTGLGSYRPSTQRVWIQQSGLSQTRPTCCGRTL